VVRALLFEHDRAFPASVENQASGGLFSRIGILAYSHRHMKNLMLLPFLLLVATLSAQQPYTPPKDLAGAWEFTPDPSLPNVMILGDSISIGYTRNVRAELRGKANVFRPLNGKNPVNCGDTIMGLAGLDQWLAGRKWHVIHCNWGLWDICYREPGKVKAGNRNKLKGKIALSLEDYTANLDQIMTRLQATGAKVIWASTTHVPDGEPGRYAGDEIRYNEAAAAIMKKRKIPLNDLHALTKSWEGAHSIGKSDVHYTSEGSRLLGRQVSAAILPLLD
jgi:hypothetical protein